ncbi:MAG: fructose-6-phosphate aldolase [Clostridium sp.]
MEFLFDTANIEDIRKYSAIYPITGVTSNPSIIKKEGKIDFFNHFKEIRAIIGAERSLHIQVTAADAETMRREADTILEKVDANVYIKIPVNEEGLKVIRALKKEQIGVTATAIYSKLQGYLAMESGADFIAPYYNRMENLDIDSYDTIACFAEQIKNYHYKTKILAASFKNIAQVNAAFAAGAQTATLPVELLHEAMNMAAIGKAVDDFHSDWTQVFGEQNITEL